MMREFIGAVSEHPFLSVAVVAVTVLAIDHVVGTASRGLSRVLLAHKSVTHVTVQMDGDAVIEILLPKLEQKLASHAKQGRAH